MCWNRIGLERSGRRDSVGFGDVAYQKSLVYCRNKILTFLYSGSRALLYNDQDIPCFHRPCIFVPFEPFPHDL